MTKTAHWWSWWCDLDGQSEWSVFARKFSIKLHRDLQKVFFSYKQVSGDHEWLRMCNAFILCDLVSKVQKGHAANREGSFKYALQKEIL